MVLHEKVFYSICFFLGGVLLGSILTDAGHRVIFLLAVFALILAGLLLFNKKRMAVFSVVLIIGGGYYFFYQSQQTSNFTAPLNQVISFEGKVEKYLIEEKSQRLDINLLSPYQGKVRLYASRYPELRYGDVVAITGTLEPVNPEAEDYFAKEGIGATIGFPKNLKVITTAQGSFIKTKLFTVRDKLQAVISENLTGEQATFMSGLLIGKSAGFSKEFQEKLKATGTTHLIALSGYNVTIIAQMIFFIFVGLIGRRKAFYFAVLAIVAFVVMTGAEASVVRAGIMASIMFLAAHVGREHSMKNAIAIAACVMVLFNPLILVFDIGFQLSFLAFLGIVYIQPAVKFLFKWEEKAGFLSWRENLSATLSAQMAVLPILLTNFGFFAPISFVTNVLLLTFIPYTMLAGFLIFLTGLSSDFLSFIFTLPAKIMLTYELFVIDFFSRFSFGLTTENFSLAISIAYYIFIISTLIFINRRYDLRTSQI